MGTQCQLMNHQPQTASVKPIPPPITRLTQT
jgi:hypothetical protein